ncbi:hypothetical protein P152DRAFT_514433 [Eremomyces bilateralis CBS 781.70]|uniref:Peroxin/Ferlin domain-containing protein n=1 Tax=Eremomyces bilateralis CBS 781.70 TaxID=1392243 RepID=A0A6G1G2D9_9PEZI|nr:uncharacterized protein P152DRAFT_514433 [Eremomyces bilateralis CBS 781.70]KAF1812277.1 hypothetical protein P152DRAFT_514433 [Eremomyces bilateralis CBS 781.70]
MSTPSTPITPIHTHARIPSRESNISEGIAEPTHRIFLVDRTRSRLSNDPRPTAATQISDGPPSNPTRISITTASPPGSPSLKPSGLREEVELDSCDGKSPSIAATRTRTHGTLRAGIAKRKWRKWQASKLGIDLEDSDLSDEESEQPGEFTERPTPRSDGGQDAETARKRRQVTSMAAIAPESRTRMRLRLDIEGARSYTLHTKKGKKGDVVYDVLLEHQRGAFILGLPLFSSKSLLNLDTPAWVHGRSGLPSLVDITNAVPPPGWRWDWDRWYVDMGGRGDAAASNVEAGWAGDVDEEGWEYSGGFGMSLGYWRRKTGNTVTTRKPSGNLSGEGPSPAQGDEGTVDVTDHGLGGPIKGRKFRSKWHGTHPFWNSFVRRRHWVRKRVRIPGFARTGKENASHHPHKLTSDYFTIHPAGPNAVDSGPESLFSESSSTLAPTGAISRWQHLVADPDPSASPTDAIENIGSLLRALRFASIDREKITLVQSFLDHGGEELHYLAETMPEIMAKFVFQQSRRRLLARLREQIRQAEEHRKEHERRGESEEEREARMIDDLLRAVEAADWECGRLQYWSDVREMERRAEGGRAKGSVAWVTDRWSHGWQDESASELGEGGAQEEEPSSQVGVTASDKGKGKVREPPTRQPTWATAKEEQDDDPTFMITELDRAGESPPMTDVGTEKEMVEDISDLIGKALSKTPRKPEEDDGEHGSEAHAAQGGQEEVEGEHIGGKVHDNSVVREGGKHQDISDHPSEEPDKDPEMALEETQSHQP